MRSKSLYESDVEIYKCIQREKIRQFENIELISSENLASAAVREAQNAILTNKYAGGYTHRRYYGGIEYDNDIEDIAAARLCKLFNVKFVNVQPHSESQANQAAFLALMEYGDNLLCMDTIINGHFFQGNTYSYGVDADGKINYERMEELAYKINPKVITVGFSPYSGMIDWERFKRISNAIGASFVVNISHIAGLISSGLYPSPFNYADIITSSTHQTLNGPRGGIIMTNNNELAKKINKVLFPFLQGAPLMHVIAAKAVAFNEALSQEFCALQKQIIKNAQAMIDVFVENDLHVLCGTKANNHLIHLKTEKYMTGNEFEDLLSQSCIILNHHHTSKENKANDANCVRIGLSSITNRGFMEDDCKQLAIIMTELLNGKKDILNTKAIAIELCTKHVILN